MTTRHTGTRAEADQPAAAPEQLEQLSAFSGALAGTLLKTAQTYLEGVTAFNGELIRFMSDRWTCDMDLAQSLARCATWDEAADLRQDWAQRATKEYLAEAAKLMQIGSKSTFGMLNLLPQRLPGRAREGKKTSAESA